MVPASAGVSVVSSLTPWFAFTATAGGEMFQYCSASPRSDCLTVMCTLAGTLAKLATVALQCDVPVSTGTAVGAQVWLRVTAPCRLLNAIGIVTALPVCGVSVTRAKYWPFARSGALIPTHKSVGE